MDVLTAIDIEGAWVDLMDGYLTPIHEHSEYDVNIAVDDPDPSSSVSVRPNERRVAMLPVP